MRVPCKNIPTYSADTGIWSTTSFDNQKEFGEFLLKNCFKEPGEYAFDSSIHGWNKTAKEYTKNGYYCIHPRGTDKFKNFWDSEKLKCRLGILWTSGERVWYITRDYYFLLNYARIINKEEDQTETFTTIRDVQYHMCLYIKIAEIFSKHAAILKRRQMLYSYTMIAKCLNYLMFENKKTIKIFASDDSYIDEKKGSWKILDSYIDFINRKTAWVRPYAGTFPAMQQVNKVKEKGTWLKEGNESTILGFTTKKDEKVGVGGPLYLGWYEEGGIAKTMNLTLQYLEPAIKNGTERSGSMVMGGSVGDLDECKPLQKMIEEPDAYDVLSVPTKWFDETGIVKNCGLFIPAQYGMPQAVDENGNSLVELALKLLDEQEEQWKKLPPEDYVLLKSQNPRTIKEAFRTRKVGEFASTMKLMQNQQDRLKLKDSNNLWEFKPVKGLLEEDKDGNIIINSNNLPPEHEYPIKKTWEDKRGCVTIYEPPIENNPKFLTYFGGVDPIEADHSEYIENQIFTPSGRKKIKDLKVGEYVIGANGKANKVTGIFPQGIKPIYRVTFTDKSSVLVSYNHFWSVKLIQGEKEEYTTLQTSQLINKEEKISYFGKGRNSWKKYTIPTYYKSNNQISRWKIPIVKPIEFENKNDLKIHPYVLGALLGDGGISQNSLKFSTIDLEILEYLKKFSNDLYTVGKKIGDSYDYSLTSFKKWEKNLLKEELINLDLFGKKSQDKFIPNIYKYSSIEDRLMVIRGLMDTDGYRGKNRNNQLVTTSERLADDLIEIVQSLGGIATKTKHSRNISKISFINNKAVIGRLSVFNVFILLPNGYIPFLLKRKVERFKPAQVITRAISNIEFEKYDEAVCISVEAEDGLYVTEHAIVTHNTKSSDSVASIDIFRKAHKVRYVDEKGKEQIRIEGDKLVATYRGRFDSAEKTNEQMWLLIKMYNAFTLAERSKPGFINYMRRNNRDRYLAKESDVPLFKDQNINNAINNSSQYGFNIPPNKKESALWKFFKSEVKSYFSSEYGFTYNNNGEVIKIFRGIDRIDDFWLLEEFIRYTEDDGENYDRISSFLPALALCKIYETNFGISTTYEKKQDDSPKRRFEQPKKNISLIGGNNRFNTMSSYKPKIRSLI